MGVVPRGILRCDIRIFRVTLREFVVLHFTLHYVTVKQYGCRLTGNRNGSLEVFIKNAD